jgi:hypothetical protein
VAPRVTVSYPDLTATCANRLLLHSERVMDPRHRCIHQEREPHHGRHSARRAGGSDLPAPPDDVPAGRELRTQARTPLSDDRGQGRCPSRGVLPLVRPCRHRPGSHRRDSRRSGLSADRRHLAVPHRSAAAPGTTPPGTHGHARFLADLGNHFARGVSGSLDQGYRISSISLGLTPDESCGGTCSDHRLGPARIRTPTIRVRVLRPASVRRGRKGCAPPSGQEN